MRPVIPKWIDWETRDVALDFNATSLAPAGSNNLTLAHPDEKIRAFWIDHVKAVADCTDMAGNCKTYQQHLDPRRHEDLPASPALRAILKESLDEILRCPIR
jgi:L-rhamnose isomerase